MFFSQYNLKHTFMGTIGHTFWKESWLKFKHTFMGTIGHTFLERELVERKIEMV